jgi:hypothetical protein
MLGFRQAHGLNMDGAETKAHGSDERSSSVSSDDILARKMSSFPLFYYMPRIAALYDKIAQGKHLSHPTLACCRQCWPCYA